MGDKLEDTTVIWIRGIALSKSAFSSRWRLIRQPAAYDSQQYDVHENHDAFGGKLDAHLIHQDLHVIQNIRLVPEICIEGHHPQLRVFRVIDAVSSVVSTGLLRSFRSDPVVLLPERCNMIPIPRSARVSHIRSPSSARLTVADPGVLGDYAGS